MLFIESLVQCQPPHNQKVRPGGQGRGPFPCTMLGSVPEMMKPSLHNTPSWDICHLGSPSIHPLLPSRTPISFAGITFPTLCGILVI